MYACSLVVLALAIFGSTQACVSNGCGVSVLGCNGMSGCYGVGVSPVIENVPIRIPGCVSPTTVQETCNCVKTIVRPHVRKEVFTIPSVQRFIQTTSTPVVETVPFVSAAGVDVPSAPIASCGSTGGFSGFGLRFGSGSGCGCGCGCGY